MKIKQDIRAERERKAKAQSLSHTSAGPASLPHQYPNKVTNTVEQVTEDTVVKTITHLTMDACEDRFSD